jgi:hypothetical protein
MKHLGSIRSKAFAINHKIVFIYTDLRWLKVERHGPALLDRRILSRHEAPSRSLMPFPNIFKLLLRYGVPSISIRSDHPHCFSVEQRLLCLWKV